MNSLVKSAPLSDSRLTRVQYLCLFAAGVLEFLSLAVAHDITNVLLQRALLVLVVLFWAASAILLHRSHRKLPVILPFVMVLWFLVIQSIPHTDQLHLRHFGFFFGVYLLAFPYAVVTGDADGQAGLKTIAKSLRRLWFWCSKRFFCLRISFLPLWSRNSSCIGRVPGFI